MRNKMNKMRKKDCGPCTACQKHLPEKICFYRAVTNFDLNRHIRNHEKAILSNDKKSKSRKCEVNPHDLETSSSQSQTTQELSNGIINEAVQAYESSQFQKPNLIVENDMILSDNSKYVIKIINDSHIWNCRSKICY